MRYKCYLVLLLKSCFYRELLFHVGKLYAVGGLVCGVGVHSGAPFRYCDNGSECFDPETGQWARVTPMNQCRSNHTVQPLGRSHVLLSHIGGSHLVLLISS